MEREHAESPAQPAADEDMVLGIPHSLPDQPMPLQPVAEPLLESLPPDGEGNVAVDLDPEPSLMQQAAPAFDAFLARPDDEPQQAQPVELDPEPQHAQPVELDPEPILITIQLPSGSALPWTADAHKPAGELKAAVAVHCGHPPEMASSFGLALGYAVLSDAVSLHLGDVRSGDTLSLFHRSS